MEILDNFITPSDVVGRHRKANLTFAHTGTLRYVIFLCAVHAQCRTLTHKLLILHFQYVFSLTFGCGWNTAETSFGLDGLKPYFCCHINFILYVIAQSTHSCVLTHSLRNHCFWHSPMKWIRFVRLVSPKIRLICLIHFLTSSLQMISHHTSHIHMHMLRSVQVCAQHQQTSPS